MANQVQVPHAKTVFLNPKMSF